MTNAIDSVRAAEAAREHERRDAWNALVNGFCDLEDAGRPIDGQELAERVAALGKGADELQSEVARKRKRREAHASIAPARRAQDELRQLTAEIEHKTQERITTHQRISNELRAIQSRLPTVGHAAEGEQRALELLRRTADPAIVAEREAAMQRRVETLGQLTSFDGHTGRLRDAVGQLRRDVAKKARRDSGTSGGAGRQRAEDSAEAARLEAEITEREKKAAKLRTAISEMDREIEALEAAQLVP